MADDDVIWVRPLCEWGQKVQGDDGRPVMRFSLLDRNAL